MTANPPQFVTVLCPQALQERFKMESGTTELEQDISDVIEQTRGVGQLPPHGKSVSQVFFFVICFVNFFMEMSEREVERVVRGLANVCMRPA